MRTCWPMWMLCCLVAGLSACGGEDPSPPAAPPAANQPAPPPAEPLPATPVLPAPAPTPPAVADVPATDMGPWVLDLARGQAQFLEKCQHCHGPNGVGGYGPALTNTSTCPPCGNFDGLWRRIDDYMPLRNPEACDASCSRDIAAWISNGFSTSPTCSVQFRYDSVTGQHFVATIRILNFRGRDVTGWRLGLTLPADLGVTTVSNALATQSGRQLLLAPFAMATTIPDGALIEVGLEGTHGGAAATPGDLRLEAAPCFTAPPA